MWVKRLICLNIVNKLQGNEHLRTEGMVGDMNTKNTSKVGGVGIDV